MFRDLASDLRLAVRALGKNRSFAAIAVATLALGIAANTAIFSVVNGVILKPLAYRDPGRLVAVHEIVPKFAHLAPRIPVNALHYRKWKKSWRAAEQIAILGGRSFNLSGSGEPEKINGARVSSALFPMLGVRAQLGRTFFEEEDHPGRDRVVVLTDGLWKRRFGADPHIVGRKIILDGNPFEVVGVLAPNFHFPKLSQLYAMNIDEARPEIWKPMALSDKELDEMGDFNYACIARLRPGVGLRQALAELNVVQGRISSRLPEKLDLQAAIVPLAEQITGRSRRGLLILLAAVSVVLLIVCVNVANLLLARATGRRREIAIRAALGAGAARLLRQALTENLLLAGLGGVLGVALAPLLLRVLLSLAPADLPRLDEIHPDVRLLVFALVTTTVCGMLFGLLPAWRLARVDPQEALKSRGRGSTEGGRAAGLRSLLVATETGLGTLCLVASGLLLHSFFNLLGVDKGFNAGHVLTTGVSLPDSRYATREKRTAFLDAAIARLRALPGVISVGVSNLLPVGGQGPNNLILPEGMNLPVPDRPLADIRRVNPDFFRTLGIPLRQGRTFSDSDRDRQTAIVSAMTAARLWPGQEALGKRLRFVGDNAPWIEVIGIVGDVRGASLSAPPTLTVYVPYWERSSGSPSFAIRTAMDPSAIAAAAAEAIHQVDPDLPVAAFHTMDERIAESVAPRRFQTMLVLLFAGVAVLLACLGIYGVVSYQVAQRTNEIGIRAALGAQRSTLLRMVMLQGMIPVAAGLAAGVVASLMLGRLLGSLLFGIGSIDGLTLAGVVAVLASVALLASYLPGRRAAAISPLDALRDE